MKPVIDIIYLGPGTGDFPLTRRVLLALPGVAVEALSGDDPPPLAASDLYSAWPRGKRRLWLQVNRQCRPRPCPATPEHLCCGLATFDLVENCPYDCHYCALQNYLNSPLLRVSVNCGDFLSQLSRLAQERYPGICRVTMGELTDCLVLDRLLEVNRAVIDLARRHPNLVVEFKSKGGDISHLAGEPGVGNAVFSFSINPQELIDELEPGTPALAERLSQAQFFGRQGFSLAFHLDPIIPGISTDIYKNMLEQMFKAISPLAPLWISLGSLRFTRGMLEILRFRFARSRLLKAPLTPGKDGKWRLPEGQRVETFTPLVEYIRQVSAPTWIYLCMETERVWQAALGWHPADSAQFKNLFDEAVAGRLQG